MTIFIYTVGLLICLLLFYLTVIRPWHLHWGATKKEVKLCLSGDDIIQKPNFNATRAITINASPERIWPWIIQIGSKRAGWYSIDWIDNNSLKSSTVILQQFQTIEIGQFIPFTPDQKNGMWVKEFKTYDYILWIDKNKKATWLWQLIPTIDGNTRLLTRLRTKYNWKGFWIIYYLVYDIGDIIIMSYCMKGIRNRVENEG